MYRCFCIGCMEHNGLQHCCRDDDDTHCPTWDAEEVSSQVGLITSTSRANSLHFLSPPAGTKVSLLMSLQSLVVTREPFMPLTQLARPTLTSSHKHWQGSMMEKVGSLYKWGIDGGQYHSDLCWVGYFQSSILLIHYLGCLARFSSYQDEQNEEAVPLHSQPCHLRQECGGHHWDPQPHCRVLATLIHGECVSPAAASMVRNMKQPPAFV